MPPSSFVPRCDECGGRSTAWCGCARCARETPDERFYACDAHQDRVEAKHERIRGRPCRWVLAAGSP